ncbi:HTH CENPB-type domain-containing protein [Nephila pilipes]|uniref:HTH CENPB-type domain-containing protein n=1 Tax=Nephila pilipes TaxID=299642 RepID=A0A8X6U0W0_NEPPI|nr:HTH CENPB-type domain-containing protein [Nephila pilipes]
MNSGSKRFRTCVYEDVDEAVLKWIHTMGDKNVPISGPFVIEKALQFAQVLGYDHFLDRTIYNNFAKAGFFACSESSESTEDEDDIPLQKMKKIWIQLKEKQEITDTVLLDDFLFLDSEAETSGLPTESDILNSVTNKNSTAMDCNEDEDENENDDNAETNKTSYDEMINLFETIRRGLQHEENTPEGIFGAL